MGKFVVEVGVGVVVVEVGVEVEVGVGVGVVEVGVEVEVGVGVVVVEVGVEVEVGVVNLAKPRSQGRGQFRRKSE